MSDRPTILITGATDGIGLALARRYHETGARLSLVGRRPLDELDDPLFTSETYCQADLSRPDCADRISAWLDVQGVERLDLLINNAGAGFVGGIAAQTPENICMLEAVNLRAPMAVAHRLLPLVEAVGGKLVFIGSVAAVMPTPDYAVYTATKAALDAFVRNLRIELAAMDSPARVQMIHPGATRTGIHAKSGLPAERIDPARFPPAEEVAAQIDDLIRGDRRLAAPGFANNLALQTLRRWPGLGRSIARRSGGDVDVAQADPPVEPEAATGGADTLHCVITGAADGIGRALALAFSDAGYVITGVDLDRERAMRTQAELINAGGKARFIIGDLGDAGQVERIADQLAGRPPVDVLIHNAGISAVGAFARLPLDPQMKVLDVNFRAPLLLTRALLAAGRLKAGGSLVFISSLSHFASYPGAAVYAASKSGLASYASSLAVALAPRNMNVLTVYPGPTRTEHARRYSPDNAKEERRMSPEVLAARIVNAVRARRHQLVPGLSNRLFGVAGRLVPGAAEAAMRRMIFEKMMERVAEIEQ
jgi:short-subunit dehydrogenase